MPPDSITGKFSRRGLISGSLRKNPVASRAGSGIDALTGFRDEKRIRFDIQGHELQGLDQSLRDLFRQDKVNITKAEEVVSIPRL